MDNVEWEIVNRTFGIVGILSGLLFTIFSRTLGRLISDFNESQLGQPRRDRLNQYICGLAGIGQVVLGMLLLLGVI